MSINSTIKIWASGGMVDTPVLGTGHASGEGSSPFSPTKAISDYDCDYDCTTWLRKVRWKGVMYLRNNEGVSLRN